jgi:ketosteroid isomerase-like protein
MSEDNVELVLRATDAYSRGDLDESLEHWAPDAVLDWSNSHGFEAGVYRGRGEIRAFMQRFREPFDEVRVELLDALSRSPAASWSWRTSPTSGDGRDLPHALPDEAKALEAARLRSSSICLRSRCGRSGTREHCHEDFMKRYCVMEEPC